MLRLADDLKKPRVSTVNKISPYEMSVRVRFWPNSHDKIMQSGPDLSAALKWGKLKHWQVTDVAEEPGGNFAEFSVTDMSHSFRLVLDDPAELLNPNLGRYSLQENHEIDLVKRPGVALLGQTGSGKSYLLQSLLYQYLAEGDKMVAIDPKNAELAKIARLFKMPYTTLDEGQPTPNQLLDFVIEQMNKRQKKLEKIDKLAVNAVDDLHLKPFHLVIEEVSSLLNEMEKKSADSFKKKLEVIARKGRSAGIYLTLVTQTFTVDSFGSSAVRQQLQNILILGRSTMGQRSQVFPPGIEVPDNSFKGLKGVGWAYMDGLPVFKVEAPTFNVDPYDSLRALAKDLRPKA